MITEGDFPNTASSQNKGSAFLGIKRVPVWPWLLFWTVLTTLAFPAAMLLAAPLAALVMFVFRLWENLRIMPGYDPELLETLGFLIGFSIAMAAAQWFLLRNYLPKARGWFLATGGGILVGGIFASAVLSILPEFSTTTTWKMALALLSVGCAAGAGQWLVLHRILPNAFWIVVIDLAAACSLLLIPSPITNLVEMLTALFILTLPGWVTGVGIWLLMRSAPTEAEDPHPDMPVVAKKQFSPVVRIGLGVAFLVPAFFLFIWIYAASQLALAKNEGVYSSVEEAVIEKNSQGWGGAEVVKVTNVRASVNQHDGSQPHVWFGGARVYLDRVPEDWDRTEYSSGSYFIHVKEGWVHVPEGAFPEFIGWVMELYGMEGVTEWIAESR